MNLSESVPPSGGARALQLRTAELGPPEAPPVLVLHGITASRRYWLPRILPLAAARRLLIPDLPGFGQSPKPFVDYTVEFFVDSLEGLLLRHGLERRPVDLVGHSLGGLLALELAGRLEPGRVGRIVALSIPRFPDPDTAHRIMLAGSASYRRLLTVGSVAASVAQVRRAGWRRAARTMRRLPWGVLADARKFTFRSLTSTLEHCLLHHRLEPALERLPPGLPIRLIHGARDQVAPLEGICELPGRPPFPELHVLPDAAHNPFHTHTARCLELVAEFLDRPPAPHRTGVGPLAPSAGGP